MPFSLNLPIVKNGWTTDIAPFMYADDTCIIAPLPCALFELLKIYTEFVKDNVVIFNKGKSKYMCFKPKSLSNLFKADMY